MRIGSFILLGFIILVSCKKPERKIDINPEHFEGLLYKNPFDSVKQAEGLRLKNAIHKSSICFESKDSTYLVLNKIFDEFSSITVALWIQPDFYGRNGTIINLSKNEKDYPINSTLSIFMNKNRVAVMQQGKDLRKEFYENSGEFTNYFMGLEELNRNEMYFMVYVYTKSIAKIYIDGKEYAIFDNVPNLGKVNYVTLGASWNDRGSKFHFNGCIDDLYIYNRVLSKEDINYLMDFTHVYQYIK